MTESISNLAAVDEYNEMRAYERMNHTPEKKEYYKSIHARQVREDEAKYKSKYNGHATMGLPPGAYKPSTDNWVKKNQFHPDLPEPKEFHYSSPVPRKPPIPNQHTDMPVCGLKSNVDWVKQNIQKAKLMIPKAQANKEVDWTQKADFGKVPEYLVKMKETIAREQEECRDVEKYGPTERKKTFRMSEEERQELLKGLKSNWNELHSEYVGGLKTVQDIDSQKNRKQWLEKRMAEIEADIIVLEKGDIYVQ